MDNTRAKTAFLEYAAKVERRNLLAQYVEIATPVQRAAAELYQMGFSVGPTKPASKMPYLWKRLTYSRIDPAYIPDMFSNGAGMIVITGGISRNLTILDADTPQAAEYHTKEFERRGLPVWIVETARGRHFWWLSGDGEIANFKGDDYEIRGHNLYCLCPPSVHPSGVIYEWARRDGELPPTLSMAALDWLPLQLAIKARRKYEPREPTSLDCLSKKNQDFIANGASEGTRNNRLFAAACDLNGNGFSHYQAQDILSPVALRCGMSQGEITDSLKSAYQKTRTPAKQPRPTPPTPFWAKARAWAESHKWERMAATVTTKSKFAKTKARVYSVSAQTARDVFLACCELARRAHTAGVFRASTREAAELADVKSDTAYRALVCLCEAGYLKRCGYSDMRAGLYAFSKELLQKGDSNLHWLLTTVPKMQQHHEAFYRGGLGKMAERIWRLTLKEAMQAAKIARRLQVNRATVGRALRRLAMFGLVTQIGRKWQGNAAGNDYLTEIAAKCGTLGKAQRRKDRHAQDRARDISQAIMGRKRKWESIHL